jgi:uncharacterized protein YdeI (YjbR/CyaY-like superfamily)
MNPAVDWFFNKDTQWKEEYEALRTIVLAASLTEVLKWGCPCYAISKNTDDKKLNNVVLIHGFKEYCALLFMKGALIEDAQKMLIQQTENVQAARQMRFTKLDEIIQQKDTIKDYILQAIALEKSGAKVVLKKPTEFKMADEFKDKLETIPALKTAFYALTPGRQRAYLLHFSAPKQSKTRIARVEKCMADIFNGKGLND